MPDWFRLREYLSEVPAERIPNPLNVADIPRLLRWKHSANWLFDRNGRVQPRLSDRLTRGAKISWTNIFVPFRLSIELP
jgi:hypothetical protein